jgi:hypothetical protein
MRRELIDGLEGVDAGTVVLVEIHQRDRRGGLWHRGRRLFGRGHDYGHRRRRRQPGAQLAADQAEDQAGRGREPDPRRPDAVTVPLELSISLVTREGDDARRTIALFEATEDLSLLRGEAFGRERGIGLFHANRPHLVEPASEFDGPLGTEVALIEMRWPCTGHADLGERFLREMSTTKNDVTEPHDWTSHLLPPLRGHLPAAPASGEWL